MTVTVGVAYHPRRDGAVLNDGEAIFLLMLWSLAGRKIDIHVSMIDTLVFYPDGLTCRHQSTAERWAEYDRTWRAEKTWEKN